MVRVLDVPSGVMLPELHDLLPAVLGWINSHLHQFVADGIFYGMPGLDGPEEMRDERGVLLRALPARFRHRYDFGDGWEHQVEVLGAGEQVLAPPRPSGARARWCPPGQTRRSTLPPTPQSVMPGMSRVGERLPELGTATGSSDVLGRTGTIPGYAPTRTASDDLELIRRLRSWFGPEERGLVGEVGEVGDEPEGFVGGEVLPQSGSCEDARDLA